MLLCRQKRHNSIDYIRRAALGEQPTYIVGVRLRHRDHIAASQQAPQLDL
jgi:hypothetical protein